MDKIKHNYIYINLEFYGFLNPYKHPPISSGFMKLVYTLGFYQLRLVSVLKIYCHGFPC